MRISLWLYDAQADRLEFLFSNEIDDAETVGASFRPGESLMGQAFLERRRRNEPDARQVPGFIAIAGGSESYDAVLCLPVSSDPAQAPLGMLTIDKRGNAFSATEESIGVALAAQCAYALSFSERRRSLS